MQKTLLLVSVAILFSISCTSKLKTSNEKSPEATANADLGFVSQPRQLTFAGVRAGEGYFSQDGRYLVFQSEREPSNPFYQIYLMDTKTGVSRRISPGQGKTTCSWIHPNNKSIIFSSTHADPDLKKKVQAELEERKNPKTRYNWSFDDTYEIYRTDFNGKNMVNLSHSRGYDAESSYSPDGQWIAFASNRAAYTGKMTPEEEAAFRKDPSYMMDIYLMKADGSDVRRLTTAPGYDGGPFFSPDGKRITFRRFNADGRSADIYTIGIDGKDEKRLTDFKSLSWAPFYHPSGDYLIFASNKFGHANFELFIIDTEGTKQPVRVTQMEGFDGLPVFSPDGAHLVWSHTNEKGEAQLYRAGWNDALARQALGLTPATPQLQNLQAAITAADSRAWVEYLASPRFEGRMSGGAKEAEYTAKLAEAFKAMGLREVNGSFFQNFEFTSGIELGTNNKLELTLGDKTLQPKVGEDWVPLSYSKTGSFPSAPLVFAGYGIVAPSNTPALNYDSYGNTDVKDKWVVVFSGLPENVSQEKRFHLHLYSRVQHKATVARQRGALGLIVIEDTLTPSPAMAVKFEGRSDDAGLPVLRFSSKLADEVFKAASQSRKSWTSQLSLGKNATLPLSGLKATSQVDLRLIKSHARNVVAMLPAKGAKSSVVIGAHLDHLGMGDSGNSLATSPGIHLGADDNASGVAGVMEIAHALSEAVKSGSLELRQNVIFGLWSAEEIGILGSNHFVNTNKLPISAYLNMDMIGRYRDQVIVQGVASAKEWPALVEKTASNGSLVVKTQNDPYVPSDALIFYLKQIPSIMFFTGSHPEYHTPNDRPDLINYPALAEIAGMVRDLGVALASQSTSPLKYEKVEGQQKGGKGSGRGFRLYLGTIPDYTREGVQGVAISGTSKGSPAEQAGLQAGDVILELGGMSIKNINDYVYCLQALKANEKTKMRVLRAGAEKELEITPVLKTAQ